VDGTLRSMTESMTEAYCQSLYHVLRRGRAGVYMARIALEYRENQGSVKTKNSAVAVIADRLKSSLGYCVIYVLTLFIVIAASRPVNTRKPS